MKRRQVLLLHHLEPLWDKALRERGMSFAEMQRRAINHIRHVDYDHVIVTRFEEWKLDDDYDEEFAFMVSTVHDYGYGWGADCLKEHPKLFVEGGNHSPAVYVPEWVKQLKGSKVFLGGCFDGECLEDIEIALRSQKINPRRVRHLIV